LLFLVLTSAAILVKGQSERCATDMTFLVDQSSSITPANYKNQVLPFLANITAGLAIGEDQDHVAFIPFSDPELTYDVVYLNEHYKKDQFLEAVRAYEFKGGNTATAKALNLAHTKVFDAAKGARTSSYGKNVAPTLLIITDGRATDSDPVAEAEQLKGKGVVMFAIGVGSLVDDKYLIEITGNKDRVFSVASYQGLDNVLAKAILDSTSSKCVHRNGLTRNA